jgi:hypothetical protein
VCSPRLIITGLTASHCPLLLQDDRWYMPDFYYLDSWDLGGNQTMDLVIIDTVALAGDTFVRQLQEEIEEHGLDAPEGVSA